MDEMRPHRLDERTADRLLAGAVSPDDAPPGYAGVAHLLDAAGTPALEGEGAGRQAATVAAMQSAVLGRLVPLPDPEGKRNMISKALTVKAAAAAAVVVLGAGSAAAATGSLPGPVQNTTAHLLSHVGLDVPTTHAPNANSDGHASSNATGTLGGTGKGPNSHALPGLCNAAKHNGGHPGKSDVFPSATTCSSVPAPGQSGTTGTGDDSSTDSSTPSTTEAPEATEPSDSTEPPEATEPPESTTTSTPDSGTRPDDGGSTTSTTAGGHDMTGVTHS